MLHLLLLEQVLSHLNILLIKPLIKPQLLIFLKYAILIFFILSFVTYTKYLRFKNFFLCGYIETNPETFNRCKSISFYHWNLNGLLACNREKFHLVEAFVVSNNIDIFCISQTFLDSSVDNINGYTMVRIYHPSNIKHGGIAIYYKDHLPVIRRNDNSSLNENIVPKIRLANNKCFLASLYR